MRKLENIGFIRTPFKEKFGIPRQASLIQFVDATIEFTSPYDNPNAFTGIESFSHIWLTFDFHKNDDKWRPMIRPPRLGGNEKIGVFASRSSFRPNNLGLSLVELRKVIKKKGKAQLVISCPDVLDNTPLYDIKPYIDYSDHVENARCSYANEAPSSPLLVHVDDSCLSEIHKQEQKYGTNIKSLINSILSNDPRPAYKQNKEDKKSYKIRLYDMDIEFVVRQNSVHVINIELTT